MFSSVKGRLITILLVVVVAGWQMWDRYQESQPPAKSPIKLGLDLQGGMHLVLGIADPDGTLTDEARADAIERAETVVRSRIDELGVNEPLIQRSGQDRLIVELAGITDQQQARDIVSQAAYLQFKLVLPTTEVDRQLARIDRQIVQALGEDSIRAMGRAVEAPRQDLEDLLFNQGGSDSAAAGDTAGAAGGAGTEAGADAAAGEDQDPGDQERLLRPFTSLLNTGDLPGTYLVALEDVETAEAFLALPQVQAVLPRGVSLHWEQSLEARGVRTYRRLYVLEDDAFMDGSELEDAVAGRDPQFNQAQVQFELSRAGGRQFSRFTSQHVGDNLAILLDDDVISAPTIRDRIGSRGQIDMGSASLEEARQLALVLRAGALPAPLEVMEERTVGPSLGHDSIEEGRIAGIVGLVLVVGIMLAYYRMAGVLAIAALIVYVVLVMGGLAGIGATLTLPGIAGLILSIGMAVDANVLIFERIREELAAGRATRTAVDEGFGNALSAIVDANVTTLITALILFQFGSGPVRGFAVTLSIGIAASFFSALYVTRSFFLVYLTGKKASDPISI